MGPSTPLPFTLGRERRQEKPSRLVLVLRSQQLEEASGLDPQVWVPDQLTTGVLFPSEAPILNLAPRPYDGHTKAVSNCNKPLASLAPRAAWHSCSVSSSASGWDVSMMAMVSPSSVHMIVC